MAFNEINDPATQMIARIADVCGCAAFLRADRQRHEADNFGRKRLWIRRRKLDEQLSHASYHSGQQAGHLFVRLEASADLILDRDETSAQLRGRGSEAPESVRSCRTTIRRRRVR